MLQYIIPIVVTILSGLGFLLYKHPVESRKLLLVIYVIGISLFALWCAYGIGAMKEHSRLLNETSSKGISITSKDYSNNALLFGLCINIGYFTWPISFL